MLELKTSMKRMVGLKSSKISWFSCKNNFSLKFQATTNEASFLPVLERIFDDPINSSRPPPSGRPLRRSPRRWRPGDPPLPGLAQQGHRGGHHVEGGGEKGSEFLTACCRLVVMCIYLSLGGGSSKQQQQQ